MVNEKEKYMKKFILVLSITLAIVSSAYAQNKQDVYVGGALGVMAVPDGADAGIGLALKAGFGLEGVLQHLAAEVEIQKSIMNPEYGGVDVDILTLAGYAVYNIAIPSSQITLKPKFGVILPNLGDDESVNSRNYGFSSGLDVVLKISNEMNGYIGYTNLGENINTYNVGVEFHF